MRSQKIRKLSEASRLRILERIRRLPSECAPGPFADTLDKTLFKKFVPVGKPDPKLSETARQTFRETEVACRHTNRRVRSLWHGRNDYASSNVLDIARRKIRDILGEFSIDEMLSKGRFGPGSTFNCRGADASKARKYSLTDVTPEFSSLARGLLADLPLWSTYLTDSDLPVCPMLDIVPGARLAFVPKDIGTDRTILVEPTVNSWFQQGIGRMIRARLLRFGVDLNDSSLNQRLAKMGSLFNDLATVDLSSASDRICINLVRDLLPDDWFFWLNRTRSHRYQDNGEWFELEKFSSMGNGFTFDLESLIFYAISYAFTVSNGYNPFWVNTFGDDIIIPSFPGCEESFSKLFTDCGFAVNRSKSFFEGPFRESCGHDYNLGVNIRGVYCKRLEDDLDVIKIHNRIQSWSSRSGHPVKDLLSFLRREVSDAPIVPPHLGDVGFSGHFDEVCPELAFQGAESYKIWTWQPVLISTERSDRFLLLDRLTYPSEFSRNTVSLRETVVSYRRTQVISHWY